MPSTSDISDPPAPCSRLESEESTGAETVAGTQKQPLDEQSTDSSPQATTTVDHNQNQIEAPKSQPQEASAQSQEVSAQSTQPTEADQTLDENENVSCTQSPARTTESLSMHCNGKAVMV